MKKNILFSGFALGVSLLASSSVFGANGANLIGISPQAVGMGGTGVANVTTGSDALYRNPSLLGDLPGAVGSYGFDVNATLINLKSQAQAVLGGAPASGGFQPNQAASKVLPSLTATYKLDDSLSLGLGILVYGGASADYKGQPALTQLHSQLTLVRVTPTVAYRLNEQFAFGLTPILKYGALAINESTVVTEPQSSRQPHGAVGFGVQVGATYKPVTDLTIGAAYLSKSSATYKQVVDFDKFGPLANAANAGLDDIKVQQPQEVAAGVAYTLGDLLLSGDYRLIGWSGADVFRELGWQDQHVIAIGAQYKLSALALRGGFNYAKSPIRGITGEAGATSVDLQGHAVLARSLTILNMVAFPAYAESHFTFGAGYQVAEGLTVDAAFMFAPEVSVERSGTVGANAYAYSGKISQWSITAGVAYRL